MVDHEGEGVIITMGAIGKHKVRDEVHAKFGAYNFLVHVIADWKSVRG